MGCQLGILGEGGGERDWEVFGNGKDGVRTGEKTGFVGFPFGVRGLVCGGVVD